MTVIPSRKHEEEHDLLGAFLRAQKEAFDNIMEYAQAYKACIDAHIEMRRYVNKEVGFRLLKIAEGRLVPKNMMALLALPDIGIERLATLPKDDQQRIHEEGLPIWRSGKTECVPIQEISAIEFRRAIDVAGGRGRIVVPGEQYVRAVPRPKKQDTEVTVRLSVDESEEMDKLAKRYGVSVAGMIKKLVRDACGLDE